MKKCIKCSDDNIDNLKTILIEGVKDYICKICFENNMQAVSNKLNNILHAKKTINSINNLLNK